MIADDSAMLDEGGRLHRAGSRWRTTAHLEAAIRTIRFISQDGVTYTNDQIAGRFAMPLVEWWRWAATAEEVQ